MTYAYDPELAPLAELMPTPDLADLAGTRARLAELSRAHPADRSGVDVRDHAVAGPDGDRVTVRVYRPDRSAEPVPAVLNLHGGGFVLGDLDLDEAACLELVRGVRVVVASVDYRLAPEHPYPAGLEDCWSALRWLVGGGAGAGVDTARVAVRGLSAGGGLAAALALLGRDRGGSLLRFQLLASPQIDDRLSSDSMCRFVDTPAWDRSSAERSWDAYLGDGRRGTADVPAYAAPARAPDLSGLPPTYVSVSEFDPLRDEGIAYAQSLLAAGVAVELHAFPGTFHGSTRLTHAAVSARQNREEHAALARALDLHPNRDVPKVAPDGS